MARELQSGQRAELFIIDVRTAEAALRFSSETLLFEAPNWSPDGKSLVINGDGRLFRLPVAADGGAGAACGGSGELEEIPLGGIAEINNDHVLSPDGSTAYVSSEDGHIYAVDLANGVGGRSLPRSAGATPRRVTNENGPGFKHYLHGVSPDGTTLAYIGLAVEGDKVRTNVYLIPSAGGPDLQVTDDDFPDDGAEFSPDGEWIHFNSERGSTVPGHAQLFRIATPWPDANADGNNIGPTEPEQLTFDERVNWFPHPSRDGTRLVYVSFPPGTLGHPADVPVVVRLLDSDGSIRDLAHVFGGQGTMNVPSWSPDGTRLAIVAYPLDG